MSSRDFARISGYAIGFLCVIGILTACESEGPEIGATISEIESDPLEFFGEMVTVSGEINEVYGPASFTIGGEGFGGQLLVVVPPNANVVGVLEDNEPYAEDDIVQVTGLVREYVVAEVEEEYGLDLVPDIEYEEQEPAVIANAVYLTPRLGVALDPITDITIVIESVTPEEMAGRTVELDEVMVQDVLGDRAFWVGPSSEDRLFVVLEEEPTPADPVEGRYDINPGQVISLVGTLRLMPETAQLDEQWDLDEAAMEALQAQTVYLHAVLAEGVSAGE